jgi:hypothetical protein
VGTAAVRGPLLIWCLAVVVVTGGCAKRALVKVPLEETMTASATVVNGIDVTTLLGTVAKSIRQHGMPLSSPVYAYFYDSAEEFELGLVTDARAERWSAKDSATFAVAVGTPSGIFLRVDKLAQLGPGGRAHVVAHELTHVSQFELGGGRGRSEQWLREGHAEWMAYRVVDALGLGSYPDMRQRVINGFRRSPHFPGLLALSTNRQWTTAAMQYSASGTYAPAFLAVDWIVERFGQAAIGKYFRRAGVLYDGDEAFREAFGRSLSQFNDEFRAHLAAQGVVR